MKKNKIAIVTDSCSDVPKQYVEKYNIHVLPLKVIYKDKEYLDGIDITPQEVYDSMKTEIPSTSLPEGKSVIELFEKLKKEGYTQVLVVTLSSGLSGTNNMIRLISEDFTDLQIEIIDSKNIAIASGFHAIQAGKYLEGGLDFDTIVTKTRNNIKNSKVFFVVETLEYLQKGGRIGLVASLFGNALNLKPIISCNEEGIYYTVTKVRGRKKSISKTIEIIVKELEKSKKYNLAICHGDAEKEAMEVKEVLLPLATGVVEYMEGQISPSLGVHTGPGLIGIGIYTIE